MSHLIRPRQIVIPWAGQGLKHDASVWKKNENETHGSFKRTRDPAVKMTAAEALVGEGEVRWAPPCFFSILAPRL